MFDLERLDSFVAAGLAGHPLAEAREHFMTVARTGVSMFEKETGYKLDGDKIVISDFKLTLSGQHGKTKEPLPPVSLARSRLVPPHHGPFPFPHDHAYWEICWPREIVIFEWVISWEECLTICYPKDVKWPWPF
ncbi:hypothetical protein KUH32_15160 [Thalassococcus sp. CAU 1522]|uniref:Uncharacterized protein n=1 Tax=Thalassococcus arenae TaxID=2851652 RepID=A0ABS6NAR0_9RHOB|nr:hypothetical protein [Thalassococcus arenae]MBV2361103.1 hypothetical protein [Thalassococcus arenae]